MADTYTREEFARSCKLRGYCSEKRALAWLREQGIETAVESDFVKCYYAVNAERISARPFVQDMEVYME